MKFVNCVWAWAVILASLSGTVAAQDPSASTRTCRPRPSSTPSRTRCKFYKSTVTATGTTSTATGLGEVTTVILFTTVTTCPVTLTHVSNGVTYLEATQTLSTIISTVTTTCPPGIPVSAINNLFTDTVTYLPLTASLEAAPPSSTPLLAANLKATIVVSNNQNVESTAPISNPKTSTTPAPAAFTGSGTSLSIGNSMLNVVVACSLLMAFCI